MKTLKVVLQEVISGVKAWANDNFSLGTHVHGNVTNDGKVGTTANLPLITGTGGAVQAGAFGNQANTFCEGNDSRLSDARTPVAHTHTKSDVTDLLNSNFIPSVNNSYDLGSSSYQWNNLYAQSYYYNGTEFQNKFVTLDTNQTISGIKTITGGNQGKMIFKNPNFTVGTTPESSTTISRIYFGGSASYDSSTGIISNDITSNGDPVLEIGVIENNSSSSNRASLILRYEQDQTRHRLIKSWGDFCPYYDNTYYLGRSDLQWKSVYAVSYYYNGTQWGLDQANVWTGRQTYGAYLKSFGEPRTDEWSGNSRTNAYLLSRRDTDDVSGFLISTFRSNQAQGTAGHIYGWDILENSTRYSGLRFTIDWDSTLNSGNGAYRVTLGTNTQGTNPCNDLHITQLKTINGLNPGALSLPGAYQGINDQIKNPSDQLNAIDLNGGSNTWVSDVDCYLYFYIPNNKFTWIRIFWPATLVRCGQTFVPVPNESSDYSGFVPVPANTTVVIQIKGTQAPIFRRSACLGNV